MNPDDLAPDPVAPVVTMTEAPPVTAEPPKPVKRGRGRPPGSKNRRPPAAAKVAAAAAEAVTPDATAPRSPGRPTTRDKANERMTDGLRNFYVGAGAMLATAGAVFGNPRLSNVGAATIDASDKCATALVAWSETNPAGRKALESLTTAGGAAIVASAHAPILLAALNSAPPDGGVGDLFGGLMAMMTDAPTTDPV